MTDFGCTYCDSTNTHVHHVPDSDVVVIACDDCGSEDAQ